MKATEATALKNLVILLAVSTLLTFLVGSRLRWDQTPGFRFMESYSVGYNHAVRMGDLCHSNPFSGLQPQTSNVAEQTSWSLIYAIPNKIFREKIDLYTLHRIMEVVFYALALFSLSFILVRLELSLPLALFMLVHWSMSAQLLSYLYEAKLTLTSVVWFTMLLLLFVAIDNHARMGQHNLKRRIFFLPILTGLGYETYTVSRPLGLVAVACAAFWFASSSSFRGFRGRYISLFFLGLFLSAVMLKIFHPDMHFDQTLFEGRTESVVTPAGELYHDWKSAIWERISELPKLLRWPNYHFSSETHSETGWLDILGALSFSLLLVTGIVLLSRSGRQRWDYFSERRGLFLIFIVLWITALVIPLLSITYVRGHRWFGFYLLSDLFLVIVLEALLRRSNSYMRGVILSFACIGILATLIHRTPLILSWQPEAHYTPRYSADLFKQLEEMYLPRDYSRHVEPLGLRVCDKKQDPDWEHFWNAALYVSGLGCRLSADWVQLSCECGPPWILRDNTRLICLQRSIENGKNTLLIRY